MNIEYPLTLKHHKQTREIAGYTDLLDLFSSTCPDAPLNELSEPPAGDMLDILYSIGWSAKEVNQ